MKRLDLLLKATLFFILFVNCGVSVSAIQAHGENEWSKETKYYVHYCFLTTPTEITKIIKESGFLTISAWVNDKTDCNLTVTSSSGITIWDRTLAHPNDRNVEKKMPKWPVSVFPITLTFTLTCRSPFSYVWADLSFINRR